MVYAVGAAGRQTWQHVYTAVTRGKQQVVIIATKKDLMSSISRHPSYRHTSLRERILKIPPSLRPGNAPNNPNLLLSPARPHGSPARLHGSPARVPGSPNSLQKSSAASTKPTVASTQSQTPHANLHRSPMVTDTVSNFQVGFRKACAFNTRTGAFD